MLLWTLAEQWVDVHHQGNVPGATWKCRVHTLHNYVNYDLNGYISKKKKKTRVCSGESIEK